MKARLPWILLALSLALNVFFVGGVFWIKLMHDRATPVAERVEWMSKELGLEPNQRRALTEFLQATRQGGRRLHESIQPLAESAWQEMAKPTPDEAAVSRAFDEIAANRRAFQRETMQSLRAFLETLTPEQRARFLELVREQKGRYKRGWLGFLR